MKTILCITLLAAFGIVEATEVAPRETVPVENLVLTVGTMKDGDIGYIAAENVIVDWDGYAYVGKLTKIRKLPNEKNNIGILKSVKDGRFALVLKDNKLTPSERPDWFSNDFIKIDRFHKQVKLDLEK